ncbi:hypothetical protein ACIBKY_51260 [Nonomuraea sp. NPDC050394]|uniref:hypothetical protein n=1 Tax=Nonomuraea sp. NPDC050394 TaxID=3364363 RepID=UPI0037ADB9C8
MLEILGLDQLEQEVYLLLLASGPQPRPDLLDQYGQQAHAALTSLRKRGLVMGVDPVRACKPSLGLAPAMLEWQAALERLRALLPDMDQLFLQANHVPVEQGSVDVLADPAQMREAFQRIHDTARTEVLAFHTAPFKRMIGNDGIPNLHLACCRIIVEEEVLDDPDAVAGLQHSEGIGCEIRMTKHLDHKMVIGDRQLGMVPQYPARHPDEDGSALLIRPGTIMDVLVEQFERRWQAAMPVGSVAQGARPSEAPMSDEDLKILWLLTRGASDRQLQRGLMLSDRTVRRRIEALMERCGVTTRFQLGVYAAQHKLVPALDSPLSQAS